MQRPLKFRAWDKISKSMLTGFMFTSKDIIVPPYYHKARELECEFMQFTGVKDKNGKEIYEGDVVNFHTTKKDKPHDFTAEVVYGQNPDGVMGWCFSNNSYQSLINNHKVHNCEVIGNIYQNKDLLK